MCAAIAVAGGSWSCTSASPSQPTPPPHPFAHPPPLPTPAAAPVGGRAAPQLPDPCHDHVAFWSRAAGDLRRARGKRRPAAARRQLPAAQRIVLYGRFDDRDVHRRRRTAAHCIVLVSGG